MAKISVFHYNGNFGDDLSPYLLSKYGIKVQSTKYVLGGRVVGIGSILDRVPPQYTGVIWTTGIMHSKTRKDLKNAKVFGVRGKETLKRLVLSPEQQETVVLGDGGLLLEREDIVPIYQLGLVPHYVDYQWVSTLPIAKRPEVKVINVKDSVSTVIKDLSSCQSILSSSLHGLIASDAMGIPNRQFTTKTSNNIIGNGFKFIDYYSIYDMEQPKSIYLDDLSWEEVISTFRDYSRPGIDAIRYNLNEMTTIALQEAV